jgi:uncharacterized protein YuzE
MKKNVRKASKSIGAKGRSTSRVASKRRIVYTDEPMELGETVPDFLPPPEKLRYSRRAGPRVVYDAPSDSLTLRISDYAVAKSDRTTPGVVLDYDAHGQIIGVELLNASRRSANPRSIEVTVND